MSPAEEMDREKVKSEDQAPSTPQYSADDNIDVGEVFNASGHKQELNRNFSLISICSIGITTGNVWAALGGSIVCSSPSSIYDVEDSIAETLCR